MGDSITALDPFSASTPKGFPGLPADWRTESETFSVPGTQDKIFAVLHHREPWEGARALFLVHGFGEHGGRYRHVPHFLNQSVDAVYAQDLRGHGRSEGLRGHIDRMDDFVEELAVGAKRLEERIRARFGKAEIHLLGHSLGGQLALRLLAAHPEIPFRSATISAPLLRIKVRVPALKRGAAYALSRIWGSLQLGTELDERVLSHDPAVAEAYASDRLVHSKMTPRFFTSLESVLADTLRHPVETRVPLLFIVPLQDELAEPGATQEFFRDLKLRDKKLVIYPDFRHESLNEFGKEKPFAEIAAWISAH